jgi:hypothetical protein
VAKDLHQKPDIQALNDLLQWPVSMHVHLVLMAGAFTNVIWPLDRSYAEDKQKFWLALMEHGVSNFGSLYAFERAWSNTDVAKGRGDAIASSQAGVYG